VGELTRRKEEQENLPAIGYQYKLLRQDQDKISRHCPRLTEQERYSERWYKYYTLEEITFWDFTYCVNKTRLPVLRSLHCYRTILRVSFFQGVQIINDYSWYSNINYLTAIQRDCFQFTLKYLRGTFPIDYLVYHERDLPEIVCKRKTYITEDPRYFVKQPTLEEWQDKIRRTPTHIRVTYQ
jgi:hypothetical protein